MCQADSLFAGPANLPPDSSGIGAAMRKTRSYQWLEAACSSEATSGPEQGRGSYNMLVTGASNLHGCQ